MKRRVLLKSEEATLSQAYKKKYGSTFDSTHSSKESDTMLEKILMYIPAEIIGAYLVIQGAMVDSNIELGIQWGVWLILIVFTPLYLLRVTRNPELGSPIHQIVISTLAFICWTWTIGGVFEGLSFYKAVYGTIAIPIVSLIIPILVQNRA